jgi:hypothetical protein
MHLRSDEETARAHRAWLRSLPALTGKSLTKLAEEIGIARSTLTRPLKADDPGTSTLHARTIEKVVRHIGMPGPEAPCDTAGTRPQALSEDAAPYRPEEKDPLAEAVRALVKGRNGVDPWKLSTRALELAGFLPGDVVLVDLNATPKPGDAVCAQVYDWGHMQVETLMRIFERAAPVDLLVSKSLDPALQQPLVVDGERVVVKGVILPHRLRRAA